ncbi:MAG: TonB C-terminal domain-containing protein [Thermodesulfobacteriota bacterium]|nr:TonB C-terminal domain-containing protein [Thermodesulfobacteriota bacterium]
MLQPSNTPNKINSRFSHNSTGIGRMLLLSFILHVLIFVVLGGFVVPQRREVKKKVYYVDLLHRPVAKPRAGRTDVRAVKKKKRSSSKKKVAKPAKSVVAKKTTKAAVKKAVVKINTQVKTVVPVKKAVVKEPPPIKKAPIKPAKIIEPPHKFIKKVETNSSADPMNAIARMRRNQRITDLKNQLASLASDPLISSAVDAPVGVVGGRGTQAGVDFDGWIKAYLSEIWALPSHYLHRGLKAKMLLRFDRHGRLIYHEMLIPSGDSFFDASVKRVVRQLQQLPSKPERRMELIVTFDPKEMLAR